MLPSLRRRLLSSALLTALVIASACAGQDQADDSLPYPSDLADEQSAYEAEKRLILDSMKARRPAIRELLSFGIVGEGQDGFLAEPPSDAGGTAADQQLMFDDNTDRAKIYELLVRHSILKALQEQAGDITQQVVDQLCPQLDEDGIVCNVLDIEEQVFTALNAALVGDPIPGGGVAATIIKAIVEPIVLVTVQAVESIEGPRVRRLFAIEYQKRAPAGSWIEVDGAWRQTD